MTRRELPFVSVLTPTRNRRIFIPQLLRNYRLQSYPLDRKDSLRFYRYQLKKLLLQQNFG